MNYWLIIFAMGLVTFGIRLLPIVLLGRVEIPIVVQRALRFVRQVVRHYPGQPVAVVTHMDLIQWLTLRAKGAPRPAKRPRAGRLRGRGDPPRGPRVRRRASGSACRTCR